MTLAALASAEFGGGAEHAHGVAGFLQPLPDERGLIRIVLEQPDHEIEFLHGAPSSPPAFRTAGGAFIRR